MKILGKILTVLLLLHVSAEAKISATVDSTEVTQGDSVTFELRLEGKNIERPKLKELCGSKVTANSQMTSSQYINGSFKAFTSYSFMFTPKKSCVIEPVSLTIDGKVDKSEPINIKVSKMVVTKNSDYILEVHCDKKEVYVGETFVIKLLFKQKRNASGVDSRFTPPEFKNFWVKKEGEGKKYNDGNYIVTEINYVISAQKAGDLSVSEAVMKVATRSHSRDNWGQWMQKLKWRSYFSEPISIRAKELPANTTLVGDFKISMSYDKKVVEANEPLNISIKIEGMGNFEDIETLKPNIKGVSIYAEDPRIDEFSDKGKYVGRFSQKMAIVADSNYTIPSITLRYFDTKTGTIQEVSSTPIEIEVTNTKLVRKKKTLHVERGADAPAEVKVIQNGVDTLTAIAIFVGGIFLGVLLMLIPFKRLFTKEDETLHVNIKDNRATLNFLIQHMNDKEANAMIQKLEAIVYKGESVEIDKKELKLLIKRLQNG